MTGVYDAYASKLGYENVKLQMEEEIDRELFAEYVEVEPDSEKAEKVLRTIRRELGLEAHERICQAAASWDKRKANAIFKTVVLGLHLPKKKNVMNCQTKDYVCTVIDLAKKTTQYISLKKLDPFTTRGKNRVKFASKLLEFAHETLDDVSKSSDREVKREAEEKEKAGGQKLIRDTVSEEEIASIQSIFLA